MTATPALTRRTLFKATGITAATAAVATVGLPRVNADAAVTGPFRHGVASGDPLGTAVVIWTRVTPTATATPGSGKGPATPVQWEVAADKAFRRIVKRGTVVTTTTRDHTVNVDVTGLRPYTQYWYRFRALGVTSPVGHTQTAGDDGAIHALRIGLVSCSNYTGGYFSAYRYLAQRKDLDVVLHLGDYLYEYGNTTDRYGPDTLIGKRDHVPAVEMTTLQHYRQRHAHYRTDVDLQAAHAAHAWIVIFDDHEVTNDTYDTGAENHQDGEGDFAVRRSVAYRAYVEWMPIRRPDQRVPHKGERFWRRFSFGPLADLSVIETRQNRSEPVAGAAGGLLGFNSPEINDPERVFMEPEQMAWLTSGIGDGSRRWHLIGNQTVFTRVAAGRDLPGRDLLLEAGIPVQGAVFNTDQWDGYGNDQLEVLQAMAASPTDTVVLTGDIHSSWANDVPLDSGTYVPGVNGSVAVEFVVPSVTSDGFGEILGGAEPATAATTALQATNPHIRYLDGIGHGYAVLDVTPDAVQTDFFHISDREDPAATQQLAASWRSERGTKSVVEAGAPIGPRLDVARILSAPTATAAAPAAPAAAAPAVTPSAALPSTGPATAATTA
ncbi:MAG: alkaline phosphatase D family protein, partial [Mycobacteriales bacterium]|nr:alkaline phosphatase D family protein [Mycobacteriales bacterium]